MQREREMGQCGVVYNNMKPLLALDPIPIYTQGNIQNYNINFICSIRSYFLVKDSKAVSAPCFVLQTLQPRLFGNYSGHSIQGGN